MKTRTLGFGFWAILVLLIPAVASAQTISVTSCPSTVAPGGTVTVTWSISGGTGSVTHNHVHYGYSSSTVNQYYTAHAYTTPYKASFTAPATGTIYLKVDAIKGAKAFQSAVYTVQVVMPTVATPTFSPAAPQTFTSTISVSISCATSGATIRYATNGTDPTSSSSVYSGSLTFSATTTLKAKAFKSGMKDSAVASGTYIRLQQSVATLVAADPLDAGRESDSILYLVKPAVNGHRVRVTATANNGSWTTEPTISLTRGSFTRVSAGVWDVNVSYGTSLPALLPSWPWSPYYEEVTATASAGGTSKAVKLRYISPRSAGIEFGSDFWKNYLPQNVVVDVAPFMGLGRDSSLKIGFATVFLKSLAKLPINAGPSYFGGWLTTSYSLSASGLTVEKYQTPTFATKFTLGGEADVNIATPKNGGGIGLYKLLPPPWALNCWINAPIINQGFGLRYGPDVKPGITVYFAPGFTYDPSVQSPWSGTGGAGVRGNLDFIVFGDLDVIVASAYFYGGVSLNASAGGALTLQPASDGVGLYGQVKVSGNADLIGGASVYVYTWKIVDVAYRQTLWSGNLATYPANGPGLIGKVQ